MESSIKSQDTLQVSLGTGKSLQGMISSQNSLTATLTSQKGLSGSVDAEGILKAEMSVAPAPMFVEHTHTTDDIEDFDAVTESIEKTYAKKDEIPKTPTKVSELENDKGYLTEHQSLEEYAKKNEIPSVPTKVSELENDKGYLTEHQSLEDYAKKSEIPTKVSAFENDAGYLKEHQSLDNYPTKLEVATELNKKQDALDKYVASVNGYSGEITLNATDVQALPNTTVIPTVPTAVSAFVNDADYATKTYVSEIASGKCQAYTFSTVEELDEWLTNTENTTKLNNGDVFYIRAVGVPDYWWDVETQSKQILETTKVELDDYAKTVDVPTKTSQLMNDSDFATVSEVDTKLGSKQDKLTEYVATVNGKSGNVNLTCVDVGAMPISVPIPTAISQLSQDATHRVVTDTEKATWNAKSNFSGKYADLIEKPTSLPANGGNADTVDDKHFVVATSAPTVNDANIITFVI